MCWCINLCRRVFRTAFARPKSIERSERIRLVPVKFTAGLLAVGDGAEYSNAATIVRAESSLPATLTAAADNGRWEQKQE